MLNCFCFCEFIIFFVFLKKLFSCKYLYLILLIKRCNVLKGVFDFLCIVLYLVVVFFCIWLFINFDCILFVKFCIFFLICDSFKDKMLNKVIVLIFFIRVFKE